MNKTIYEFSQAKNKQLIEQRHISFEEIISAIEEGQLLDIVAHPQQTRYPHQQMFVVEVNNYVYLVPFVRQDNYAVFLKTIFPSRKAKKYYCKIKEAFYEN